MSLPTLYLVLGAIGSGRRAVVADLIAHGMGPTERVLLLEAETDRVAEPETEAKLAALPHLTRATWALQNGTQVVTEMPAGIDRVFLVLDGRTNPIDQIEAVHLWLPMSGLELGRIITVVHCRRVHAHPELLRWYDALVHFSDVVLLERRDGVPNKWISDFATRFKKQSLPCLVEFVRKGEVDDPVRVLVPEARRLSMLFDAPEDWPDSGVEGADDDDEDDEGGEPAPLTAQEIADGDLIGGIDPYLERLAGSGRRAKELPDITRFLD